MATQTYCTLSDIESIVSSHVLLRILDDNEDGTSSTAENVRLTNAIEQAASQINVQLKARYRLTELVGSDWCKWCNAWLAVSILVRRRGNPELSSIEEEADRWREQLDSVRLGRISIDKPPSTNPTPAVSTFVIDLGRRIPVRVRPEESVRPSADGIKRNVL